MLKNFNSLNTTFQLISRKKKTPFQSLASLHSVGSFQENNEVIFCSERDSFNTMFILNIFETEKMSIVSFLSKEKKIRYLK
jgi:hypothetical protein